MGEDKSLTGFTLAEGDTFTDAVKNGLGELGVSRDEVDVEVVTEPEKKGDPFVVKLTLKSGPEAQIEGKVSQPPSEREEPELKEIPDDVPEFDYVISPDGYEARLTFSPKMAGESKGMSSHNIIKALEERGVVWGVIPEKVEEAAASIKENKPFKNLLLARGQRAEPGEDSRLEVKIDLSASVGKVDEETGKIDFKERDYIKTVKADELLAVKLPAEKGKRGVKLTGEEVPVKEGRDRKVKDGKGVEVREGEDGTIEYFARDDGHPIIVGDFIDVSKVTTIEGDVDYRTGNIRVQGSVTVLGKVNPKFEVEAEGDVFINDYVEGAKITAGGNVVLKSGIKGMDKGVIVAGGEVHATYIERARVQARGDVVVKNIIMDSDVDCGGRLKAADRKGHIIGGTIKATHGIEAKRIGSDFSTNTVLMTGKDPFVGEELKEAEESLKQVNDQVRKIEKTIPKDILNKHDLSKVPESKRESFQKVISAWERFSKLKKELERNETDLKKKEDHDYKSSIVVREIMYPRVKVVIGGSSWVSDKELKNVRLFENKNKGEIEYSMR